MSRRDVIVAKTAALLQAALPSAHVHRYPMRPIERDELPALCVYLIGVKPADGGPAWGIREYDLELRIEARTTGQLVDQALDPLISAVQAVMLREPFLDGEAFHIREGEIQFDALDRERTYAAAALDYVVRIAEDPSGQGPEPLDPPGAPARPRFEEMP